MSDAELKRLIGSLIELVQDQSKRMATKDDIANMATKDDIANMATKDDIAALTVRIDSIESRMATKDDLIPLATKDDLAAVEARLEAKIDHLGQRTADLIQKDRGDIAELRGALDMLGKRFDAIVRPAAE